MNNEEYKEIVRECAEYFRGRDAYDRVFPQMKRNFKKYGKASGYISLNKTEERERRELGGFLGKTFYEETVRFHMGVFQEALGATRFGEVLLKDLLEEYFGEVLVTNKTQKESREEERKRFFKSLREQAEIHYGKGSASEGWLSGLIHDRSYGYQLLLGEYQRSEDGARALADTVCRGLQYLEGNEGVIRLALLGAEITRDPHAFDRGTGAGRLLIQALGWRYGVSDIQKGEDIFMLYHMADIRPDDISSFTTAYGISLYMEEGEHMAYRSFMDNREPYVITLSNLSRIARADCESKCIYVIENQMVFSHLCEELQTAGPSLLCTSGQVKTASYILIDLLCEAGCQIYYNGDFDPEGVNIADKVLRRRPERIRPWHMGEEDYYRAISDNILTEERLQKLRTVKDDRLHKVRDAILREKRAGYQEQLIPLLLEDIRTHSDLQPDTDYY